MIATRLSRILAALTLCTPMFATPASAGEITRSSSDQPFAWTSTECRRPAKPTLARSSSAALQSSLNAYALKVELYIDCIQREAQRDYDRAQREMQEAVEDALGDATEAVSRQLQEAVDERR